MTGLRVNPVGMVVAGLAVAALAGCGHSGSASVGLTPPTPNTSALFTGVVDAPNGLFADATGWWRWAQAVTLVPRAYGLLDVMPIQQANQPVSLYVVDEVDAADGSITSPRFLARGVTDDTGEYEIRADDPDAQSVDTCRLMVAVGGGAQLTRGFVVSDDRTTTLDAVSEGVVEVVLNRIANQRPVVQLCTFSRSGLQDILVAANAIAIDVSGDDVAQINQNAYATLLASGTIHDAIDNATGVPVVP
jgi:hypothetical protein